MQLSWIKKVYLYLVSLIALIILVIAAISLINLVFTTWIFPKADNNYYMSLCSKPVPPVAQTNPEEFNYAPPVECVDDKEAEDQRTAQKQRDASQALAMIIVATPVFFYHWKLARKES